MSIATLTRPLGDPDDDALSAFLAQVPAARDYDDTEYGTLPRASHRPARSNDRRRAIDESLREGL